MDYIRRDLVQEATQLLPHQAVADVANVPDQFSQTTVRLPESPRKIDAGLKLYRRNPSSAPASGTVANASAMLPFNSAPSRIVTVANSPAPAASPSTPSIRLNAF